MMQKFAQFMRFISLLIFILIGHYAHSNSDPSQKSMLPNAVDPEIFTEISWSTYRPQLYFGLKNRRADSPVFGLTWYQHQQETKAAENVQLRNWALTGDHIVFVWKEHNGRDFGRQELLDGGMNLTMDWFNFGRSSWAMRLRIQRPDWDHKSAAAFVPYLAINDYNSSMKLLNVSSNIVDGYSPAVNGEFRMQIRNSNTKSGNPMEFSQMAIRQMPNPDLTKIGSLIKDALKRKSDGAFTFSNVLAVTDPNFIALHINVHEDTIIEILFESQRDTAPRSIEADFEQRLRKFRSDFAKSFPMPNGTPPELVEVAREALSNLLGGIGVWHGSLLMRSAAFGNNTVVKPYGPHRLISAVPCRIGFPRGFLWDEGFHNLLISQLDPELSLQILGSYLDIMNVDGWIPREIVLGPEAEARIPPEYLVQEDTVANPPMFLVLLRSMIAKPKIVAQYRTQLVRMYPRVKLWYTWLRDSQRGTRSGSFRWRGRTAGADNELNPRTLASGFDDYPRATHPTDQEYHLDLRCWMAMSATVLVELATLAQDGPESMARLRADAEQFNDVRTLNELHWSEKVQRYVDYGLHSESVQMVHITRADGQMVEVRRVLVEPKYGFVEDAIGYPNLFPLLLKLLPPSSSRLGNLLKDLADPELFWTPFGLRSMSSLSPYYNVSNNAHQSPYWRHNIWININYLALDALRHYAGLDGPFRGYTELRNNIVDNMAKEYMRTGFIWEHYDDVDGQGGGQSPFTGWSALVVNIMAEIY